MKLCKAKVIFKLLVLLSIRSIKFYFARQLVNVAYSLSNMIPELISSMNDFAFTFFVDLLTNETNEFNKELNRIEMDLDSIEGVESRLQEFHELSQAICKIYCCRLILTMAYNFIQLVISLYWMFIRIIFNHLEGVDGFLSCCYFIQPFLCICTIFYTTQQYLNAVTDKIFMLIMKDLINVCFRAQKHLKFYSVNRNPMQKFQEKSQLILYSDYTTQQNLTP